MGTHGNEIVRRLAGERGDFFRAITEIDNRRNVGQPLLLEIFGLFIEVFFGFAFQLIE